MIKVAHSQNGKIVSRSYVVTFRDVLLWSRVFLWRYCQPDGSLTSDSPSLVFHGAGCTGRVSLYYVPHQHATASSCHNLLYEKNENMFSNGLTRATLPKKSR